MSAAELRIRYAAYPKAVFTLRDNKLASQPPSAFKTLPVAVKLLQLLRAVDDQQVVIRQHEANGCIADLWILPDGRGLGAPDLNRSAKVQRLCVVPLDGERLDGWIAIG